MKKNNRRPAVSYSAGTVLSNAVEPAAPASVWGKGCAGKGMPTTTNATISEAMQLREIRELSGK